MENKTDRPAEGAGKLATPAAEQVAKAIEYLAANAGDNVTLTGESLESHARGTIAILEGLRVDTPSLQAAALFLLPTLAMDNEKALEPAFGPEVVKLVHDVRQLLRIGAIAGLVSPTDAGITRKNEAEARRAQVEALRKMLLAFAQDIRVVLIRLASRLQSLRWLAQSKRPAPEGMARETLDIYAPLANRLGIWQLKWELEDLGFRFEDPDTYKRIARLLDEKRIEREKFIGEAIAQLQKTLHDAGIQAEVSGRPKHIYSIWKKMRGKELDFADLYDVRAFRVIVDDIKDCYTVLGFVHHMWQPIPKEFDDYISRPKANGYMSLHTVVIGDDGRALEVQIRTREMHHFAEYGVAAHWRYKEAGSKGYAGQFSASERYDEKIAWLRQLLAWKDDAEHTVAHEDSPWEQLKHTELDDHIYVLTPQARVIALPQGATPVDFAYYLHSDLGHRCRGARVDGTMVPLNTPLKNGQTVEIVTVKQGGPSRDWLNPELRYLASGRAKTKVRAWFNALELEETLAQGRALIDKTLQREGKTAVNLEDLAAKLGFKSPDDLYAVVAKDELSLRRVEAVLRSDGAPPPAPVDDEASITKKSKATSVARGAKSGVLVVGVDSLLTQMSRCCKPAPPDPIVGFVTRGRGVSIHRQSCATFQQLATRAPGRVIQTEWGQRSDSVYPIDIQVEALDRQGLLRDISEILSRERINVTGVRTLSSKGVAKMQFTAEVAEATQLQRALTLIEEVQGVLTARRK
ncbi:bifunctional (p)ppGpp synthetase/guanosine-3',5'-bis(diphosphate) 3'-pyrophosphohydrolase [Ralstonia insidiosa]|jgi:GTP pyrophosphokinase|uniref:RelA/SpoT family protein n=1 Tax=Ralstonia TaxID=48736 RepID=UPI000664AF05|nr:bifunctional (p)ppGpp synthetase/guanosine-3',5'-bis(diphosphate) 3'-pyrophosphohydrolase [Ralstonia insidiosa]KMW47961.1 GTP pyrophosphokinase [Ralstonia sp. MD27]MBX3770471.1 bifunctional (p)ppGpp synthetase/guanosine-3',5'-bis(diphosphate) 3'-pyrophosphohydrolase [Ralstonia pickettii]NOZ14674.1 bifunctional (p)ppGpp synthetase/guanosine-3',5'-bis(diphosphate) 3'-pyrophosphohydrolase [Betaproteobacteria bacterium]MBA9854633.1 bifunctional (p)ppGpp synthetase/guanosine-3',5'-bis(diphosphate